MNHFLYLIHRFEMATTYAALVSLMNVLTRYQHPTCPVSFNRSELQSMLVKVSSLVDFLESYSQIVSEDLLRKMTHTAFDVEDKIESYYVDQVLATSISSSTTGYDLFCQNLEKSIEVIDLIIGEAMEVKEKYGENDKQPISLCRVSPGGSTMGKATMVGLDEELVGLMDRLTSYQSSRQILPIVGMGGIGKTTLARNLFEHPYVKNYFHILAWVTITQDYTVDEVIKSILSDIKVERISGQQLYQHLWGRKYLIILDDIWDGEAWNKIKRFFPDNNNGSRILITTRIWNVSRTVGSCSPHEVKLLDANKSWDLLSKIVFEVEVCPPEFLKCGKEIASSCKGLPLTISVVGGLLKAHMTLKYWENVSANVKSNINIENYGHCLKILSLSYDHLPIHLKPCFLYMATFKEDEKVNVADIIKLWVADGFLKPQNDRSLEEVALEYLKQLIDRNLIMVAGRGLTGEIGCCSLHDLLRGFCLREAKKELFFYQVNKDVLEDSERLESERRLICYLSETKIIPFQSMSVVRSLTCIGKHKIRRRSPSVSVAHSLTCEFGLEFCRLLRVLRTDWVDLNVDIRHLVNLRLLKCGVGETNNIPRFDFSLPLFWNVETINIFNSGERMIAPFEFWELSNLRHVFVFDFYLVDPTCAQSNCVLNNLQTLGIVKNFNISGDVVKKIPELKTLVITYDDEFCLENSAKISCYLINLASLHKLQKLSCSFLKNLKSNSRFIELHDLTFSPNLRELYLAGSHIPWECMTIVGSLPKLESLRLEFDAFDGVEWNSIEGEFKCLKYLSIRFCNLLTWGAERSHFPMLMCLELEELELNEIPFGIGEVQSLQSIKLTKMKMSVVISAKDILDERQDLEGDNDLVIEGVYVGPRNDKREFDDMSSNNFRVKFIQGKRKHDQI